jgi:hypothetical protein
MNPFSKKPFQFRLRSLFLLVTLCSIGSCCVVSCRSQSGYHVSRENAPIANLPADATEIDYYLYGILGPSTQYSFNTSEPSFLEWVKQFKHVKPVEKLRFSVSDYVDLTGARVDVDIVNGYFFEYSFEDSGTHIAYDKDTGRVYYFDHSR